MHQNIPASRPLNRRRRRRRHRNSLEITFPEAERSSLVNMGRHFGDLAKVRHVITYSLSPFEQRAFPNYFSKGLPNVWRRFTGSFFKVAPPMVLMYVTYSWGNSVHEKSKKKNLDDYAKDE